MQLHTSSNNNRSLVWYLVKSNCVIFIQVAEGYEPSMKKTLLLHFLNIFQSKQMGHDHLVVIMQMLILPMLAHSFQNEQTWDVIDTAIIKTIVDKLLDPPEEVYYGLYMSFFCVFKIHILIPLL